MDEGAELARKYPNEPDLELGGFRLWVLGREFPGSEDYWDGNWLRVRAEVVAQGTRIRVEGPILRVDEVLRFARQCEELHGRQSRRAILECMEPNLSLLLAIDDVGRVTVEVTLTPEPVSQSHRLVFELDQSCLLQVVQSCRNLLEKFPMREHEKFSEP